VPAISKAFWTDLFFLTAVLKAEKRFFRDLNQNIMLKNGSLHNKISV
jgi:hypothetical protein